METRYAHTIETIAGWAEKNENIRGIVVVGSHVRSEAPGDEWSDLDLIVFADDPDPLIKDPEWLGEFGDVVCLTKETVEIDFKKLTWFVQRPLYDDMRALDISILPYNRLDDAIELNKDIHHAGYRVVFERENGVLDSKIRKSLGAFTPHKSEISNEAEYREVVDDLLYHIIWAKKKIKRRELWTAVNCINCYMKNGLLRLIELYNRAVIGKTNAISYEGRLLERRTDRFILEGLRGSFSKYDGADALDVLGNLLDFIREISVRLSPALGYPANKERFEKIKELLLRIDIS